MKRFAGISAACGASLAVMLFATAGLSAQGARSRGTATTQGRAVQRGGAERGAQSQAPAAPQAGVQRAEPGRTEGRAEAAPPVRRFEAPPATAVPRSQPRTIPPAAVPPQIVQPLPIQPLHRTVRPNDHFDYRPNYGPIYRPRYQPNYRTLYRPNYRVIYRPYYTFRPRVSLGFGLWVGYPVTYPTYFYPVTSYPYGTVYPSPNVGYLPPGSSSVAVGAAGGLSFDITPEDAGVYIDGQYVGVVGDFSPNQPPLGLAPGRHHVEIRAPGFEVIAFDVDILPGQVIPYRGDLQRF
jgi:hypothetical protein